jgi:hypothetical protein
MGRWIFQVLGENGLPRSCEKVIQAELGCYNHMISVRGKEAAKGQVEVPPSSTRIE